MTPSPQSPISRQFPKKWLLVLVVALIAYSVLQPIAQQRLGWQLPSLASSSLETDKANQADQAIRPQPSSSTSRATDRAANATEAQLEQNRSTQLSESQASESDAANSSVTNSPKNAAESKLSGKSASTNKAERRSSTESQTSDKPSASTKTELLHGRLREVGPKRYVSPAGLLYLPGSEEGHRLQHLERHLQDMPDRPGKHGVFEGDMSQVIDWIDDAYTRGQRGGRGIRKTEEDGRTIYEVPFDKPIGYVGGRDGGHSFNPAAKRLRLVVDGNKFITAFPF